LLDIEEKKQKQQQIYIINLITLMPLHVATGWNHIFLLM